VKVSCDRKTALGMLTTVCGVRDGKIGASRQGAGRTWTWPASTENIGGMDPLGELLPSTIGAHLDSCSK